MNIHSNLQAPATTTIEPRLRVKWAALLGVDAAQISGQSDFFSIGGNSMLLLSLHIFVTQEFNINVLIPDLMENAAFSRMVELIRRGDSAHR